MASPRPLKVISAGAAEGVYDGEPVVLIGSLPSGSVPNATTSVKGVVNRAAAVPNLAATPADLTAVATTVNDLLAKLRTAGVLTP